MSITDPFIAKYMIPLIRDTFILAKILRKAQIKINLRTIH